MSGIVTDAESLQYNLTQLYLISTELYMQWNSHEVYDQQISAPNACSLITVLGSKSVTLLTNPYKYMASTGIYLPN